MAGHLGGGGLRAVPEAGAHGDQEAALGQLHRPPEHHGGLVRHHLRLVAPGQLPVHGDDPLHALAAREAQEAQLHCGHQ